ncbi:hypothetical protein LPB248_06775 [Flavobacterium sp. LPB0248]|uniref:hypothetical protein n=1 Tax=Flavobacterium sp. LPB0248 TaxID=2614441 RepID=UPI0015A58602|nr:hypothetical protein [Flavobacterium sp. LPB0248]QLC65991.1 hypothetical protein LPB248_06775 [Flavobacterium sp. LPB0248]
MELLGTLITIISLIVHIVQKVNESSYGNDNRSFYRDVTYEVVHEFTQQEKLDNMNIDSLNICYKTAGISGFSIEKARRTLLNSYVQSDFYIDDVIICHNCMYIKVMHAIPYNSSNKCYGASFSINYMTVNDGVSVYGSRKINADEELVFKEIANELINAVS